MAGPAAPGFLTLNRPALLSVATADRVNFGAGHPLAHPVSGPHYPGTVVASRLAFFIR